MVDRQFFSALDHVIESLCRFSLPGYAALMRLADYSRLCFLILALCLSASIAARNSAALLIPIGDGVKLILLKSWSQRIVTFIRLLRLKLKMIFPAATVLSEKPFTRLTISEAPSARM